MTATLPNPFAPLLDASAVLAACANSERLGALPVRSFHHADLPSTKVSKELAEFDATIDAAPLASIGYAAGVGTGRAAGATSAVKSSRKHRRAVTVEPVVVPVLVPAMAIEPARLVPSPRPGSILPAVLMSASAVPMVQLRVQVQVPSGQAQDCWWSAPITWYSRQLRFLEVTAAWFAGDFFVNSDLFELALERAASSGRISTENCPR